ncbi:hypothetical protein JOB18_000975 [Solea senegalensis]|uniref:Uncharacterized protein n=1 Tax=Solea senegalensis TaxID=28829 RepID=A0AAV6QTX3_SOLSE|nr:hypothetical protein JOB18_000975 [Solea senegalensis]
MLKIHSSSSFVTVSDSFPHTTSLKDAAGQTESAGMQLKRYQMLLLGDAGTVVGVSDERRCSDFNPVSPERDRVRVCVCVQWQ